MADNLAIKLRLDESGWETVNVRPVGDNCYRLLDTPLWWDQEKCPLHIGDVIEAESLADGTHQFLRVSERAALRHYDWILPGSFIESPEYASFCAAIVVAGGGWERAMGGLFWAHLPADTAFDAQAELDRRIAEAKSASPGSGDQ